jgi:hypothetical protein
MLQPPRCVEALQVCGQPSTAAQRRGYTAEYATETATRDGIYDIKA